MQYFKASEITSKMSPSLCLEKFMIFQDVQTMGKPNIVLCKPRSAVCKLFLHDMQTHKSQEFQIVLQNPLVTLPILMCLLRAAHSWFNQVKSLLGVKKSLPRLSQFSRVCPPSPPMPRRWSDLFPLYYCGFAAASQAMMQFGCNVLLHI